MHYWENRVVASLPPSGIRAIYDLACHLQSTGQRVYHLALGRPDMDTPAHIKRAAIDALDAGCVHYAPTLGITRLRESIAEKLSPEIGWMIDAETEVLVTAGAGEALFIAMTAILNPGDQVMIGEHSWINYPAIARMLGAEIIYYRMPADNGFEPDLDDIKAKWRKHTRMLVLNSPNNPTGAVFSEEFIRGLASFAIEKDLLILSDECYRKIIFPGSNHVSPARIQGMRERTIVVDSFSKTYSMTGWRLGYLVAPSALMPSIVKVHQYNCGTVCSFGQVAAAVALNASQESVDQMCLVFRSRCDFVMSYLKSMPYLESIAPSGTFYIYPKIKNSKITSLDFTLRLLESTGVATVPGTAFGPGGEGYFRISCTLPEDALGDAMTLIKAALPKILDE